MPGTDGVCLTNYRLGSAWNLSIFSDTGMPLKNHGSRPTQSRQAALVCWLKEWGNAGKRWVNQLFLNNWRESFPCGNQASGNKDDFRRKRVCK